MFDGPFILAEIAKLLDEGRFTDAWSRLQPLADAPDADAQTLSVAMANCLALDRPTEAAAYGERSLALDPTDALQRFNVCALLLVLGRSARVIEILEPVLAERPTDLVSRTQLIFAYSMADRDQDALQTSAEGLRLHPGDTELINSYYGMLSRQGRADAAVEGLQGLWNAGKRDVFTISNLASTLNYVAGVEPRRIAEAHACLAQVHLGRVDTKAQLPDYTGTADPHRPLRLGILSPDLRQHSVGFFIEPVIERLDRSKFELFCYYTAVARDSMNTRIRGYPATWRECMRTSDTELATLIRADQVDVLVELSGLTLGNRLGALAYRPAPIQVTYLGYPHSTGCPFVDARLVDSRTDPPGVPAAVSPETGVIAGRRAALLTDPATADDLAAERLVRIDPCFLCYRPPLDAGGPTGDPGERDGPIVFGCFGALPKFTEPTLYLWARLLSEFPGSTLLLKTKTLDDPRSQQFLAERFRVYGIGPDRLVMLPQTKSMAEHLATYHRIDIALDTFPYHGTTTTCEALFMGTPTVSMQGNVHVSRVGLSLLSAVGVPELAAFNDAEYLDIARRLAENRGQLRALRATLRDRLLASPLCDEAGFTRRFEGALRGLWSELCALATQAASGHAGHAGTSV